MVESKYLKGMKVIEWSAQAESDTYIKPEKKTKQSANAVLVENVAGQTSLSAKEVSRLARLFREAVVRQVFALCPWEHISQKPDRLKSLDEDPRSKGKMDRKRFRIFFHQNLFPTSDLILDRIYTFFNSDIMDDINLNEFVIGFGIYLKGNSLKL